MTDIDPRVVKAAENNGDLYAAMFSSKGLSFERTGSAFVAKDPPPAYYSNLTVLRPGMQQFVIAELKQQAEMFGGRVSLKDGFAELDLAIHGFEVLFGARWIWKEPAAQEMPFGWKRVSGNDLIAWESAWKDSGSPSQARMFNQQFLNLPEIAIYGRLSENGFNAGCILNRSKDCVGLSNMFAQSMTARTFSDALGCAADFAPGLPIVGYETGDALDLAIAGGFDAIGDLRILATRKAKF